MQNAGNLKQAEFGGGGLVLEYSLLKVDFNLRKISVKVCFWGN